MAKDNGNKNRKGTVRRARRDVRIALAPQLNQIDRARQQARSDYEEAITRMGSAYDALARELAGVGSGFTGEMANIAQQFGSQVGGLGNLIGGAAAPAERAAAQAFLGTIGGVGTGLIGTSAARNAAYNASALRQGAIERLTSAANMTGNLQQVLDDIRQQKLDVTGLAPQMFKQRLDELRDLAFEHMMAKKEFGLRAAAVAAQTENDKALSQYLMQVIQSQLKGKKKKKNKDKGGSATGPPKPPAGYGSNANRPGG